MTPPTLVDGTIYVGTGVAGGDYGGRIAAIDARTGKQRWIFKTAMFVSTPVTVSGGMAYALDQTGTLYALDATTGKQVWSAPTGALTTTPAVADGLVYVGTVSNGYGVAALDARSGKRRWSFTATELVESAPTVVDGVVYVGGSAYVSGTSYPGVLYALDARTGKEHWRAETPQTARGAGDLATTPAVANGLVYATSKGGTLYAIDTATGKTVWTADDCATPPAVADGAVYCGGSTLHAFNAKTGKELWRGSATSPNADPVVAGDRLYLAAIGHLNVIDAATGKLVTTVNAPIALNYEISPLVVDGVVYVNGRNMNGTGWLLAIGGS